MQCTIIKHNPIKIRYHKDLEMKEFNGAKWYLIFRHNNHNGTVLFSTDKQEFLKTNTIDKFSELNQLDDFKNNAGEYEFMLEYDSNHGQYNRWKQTSNFVNSSSVAGYSPIHIDWTTQYWGGLRSSTNYTWAKGSSNDYWYYAIGAYQSYEGGIPKNNGVETSNVRLWVRDEKKEK